MEDNGASGGGGGATDAGPAPSTSKSRRKGSSEPKVSVRRSCDFCRKRRRHCDGGGGDGRARCSNCIAKNQPECIYSLRAQWKRLSTNSASASTRDGGSPASLPPPLGGPSSRHAEGGEKAGGTEQRLVAAGSGAAGGAAGVTLPLKRGRFSASPATGLIGLQENGFLDDFFGCLGFLSVADESTIRRAMVSIMVAVGAQPSEAQAAAPLHGGGVEDLRNRAMEEEAAGEARASTARTDGRWSDAVAAGGGRLPSDASTCLLWCAIALGALVRGCPLTAVERYFDLAQSSLPVSLEGATVDTVRAHVAMAFLHNFLGNHRTSHEYLKLANDIVNTLPPQTLPIGTNQVLRYAGKAWVFESELASAEDISGYWENATPIWQLSNSVGEHDVSELILSVDARVDQNILGEKGPARVFLAEEQPPESVPVASVPCRRDTEAQEGNRAGTDPRDPWAATGVNHGRLSAGIHKEALPQMLRLRDYLERRLGHLQFVNNHVIASWDSFQRALDTILRYPGLCRYTCWSHFAHCHLWFLAFGPDREPYERVRAVYNPVRPVGAPPAPSFEEWRGISDICDHAYCRNLQVMPRWHAVWLCSLLNTCSSLILANCSLPGPKLRMSAVHVEVTSDFACPWCHVGKARLNAAVKDFERLSHPDDATRIPKVHVSYRPYMIDVRTQPNGEDYLAYNERRWGGDGWTTSMKRSARKDGCEFAKWVTWPNSLLAHRLQMFAERAGKGDQVNGLVFHTIYERGGNASDLETLVSLAEEAGLSPAEARAYLRSREGEDDVLRNDRTAKTELGVRGVPYFVVRAAEPEAEIASDSGSTAAAADAAGASSGGGKGRPAEVVLKGAVGTDELLRAFAAVSPR